MNWLETFRRDTATVIAEPWWLCLAEAIAVVESDHGRAAIAGPLPSPPGAVGLNEIGYKALAGHPALVRATREADGRGNLRPVQAAFRLFADRAEQARALLWLLRSSVYFESARLLFVLAFYAAYAPGRVDGARSLVGVFNELARSGAHPGVGPILLAAAGPAAPGAAARLDDDARALNHAAARQAVRLFAELTAAPEPHAPPG